MRNGREGAGASGASSGTATTSSSCAERDNKPSKPAGWWPRSWPRWGCTCTPTRPGSWGLTKGRQGFDFLGFHHHKVESWRWRGRWYLQRWPATRALNAIRAKIREATDRRFVGHGLAWIVANLNRVLRGWGAYFRHGNSARKFAMIDSYVHERLAIFASIKHGLRYH